MVPGFSLGILMAGMAFFEPTDFLREPVTSPKFKLTAYSIGIVLLFVAVERSR